MSMSVSTSYPRPLLTPGRLISTHTHTHTHTLLPVTIVNTACSLSPDTLHTHITGHLTSYTLTHIHTHTHTHTHTQVHHTLSHTYTHTQVHHTHLGDENEGAHQQQN